MEQLDYNYHRAKAERRIEELETIIAWFAARLHALEDAKEADDPRWIEQANAASYRHGWNESKILNNEI